MRRVRLYRDLRAGEIARRVEAANEHVELLRGVGFAGREGCEVAHNVGRIFREPRDHERAEAKRRAAVERDAQARRARLGIDRGFARHDPRSGVSLRGETAHGSRLRRKPRGLLKDRALRQSPPGLELGDRSCRVSSVGEQRSSNVEVYRGNARRQSRRDADLHRWRCSLAIELGIDGRGEITRGFDRIASLHLRFRDQQIQELRGELGICLPARERQAPLDGSLDFGRSGNLDAIAQYGLGLVLRRGRGQAAGERCDREQHAPAAAVTARRMR